MNVGGDKDTHKSDFSWVNKQKNQNKKKLKKFRERERERGPEGRKANGHRECEGSLSSLIGDGWLLTELHRRRWELNRRRWELNGDGLCL